MVVALTTPPYPTHTLPPPLTVVPLAVPETLMEPLPPTTVPPAKAPSSTVRELPEATASPMAEAPDPISSPWTMAPC